MKVFNTNGAQVTAGIAGDKGDSSYTYIAYASSDTGTDFTLTFNANLNYIAIKTITTAIVAPAVGDFTGLWKNYKGATGLTGNNGADGDNAYVYIAYASDDSGTDFTNTFNASLNYIAIKTTTVAIGSPQASDFTGLWKNYKGATGSQGNTGLTGPGVFFSNSILSGSMSGNVPNILSAGSGLTLNVAATTTNIVASFCAGITSSGPITNFGAFTTDDDIALTDDSRNYIYLDRNINTGVITLGATTVIPKYGYTWTGSPVENEHNLILHYNTMYAREYNSAPTPALEWKVVQRTFIGEVLTVGGDITEIYTYSYNIDYSRPSTLRQSFVAGDAATIEMNAWQSVNQSVEITSTGRTLNIRNLTDGCVMTVDIIQGSGGSKTITDYNFYGSDGAEITAKWKGKALPVLTTTAAVIDNLTIKCDNNVVKVASTLTFEAI